MTFRYLISAVFLIVVTSAFLFNKEPELELKIVDPTKRIEGRTFSLLEDGFIYGQCQFLPNYTGNKTYKDMEIKYGKDIVNNTISVDEKTINFTIGPVKFYPAPSSKPLTCITKNPLSAYSGISTKVTRKPKVPSVDCVCYNWLSMECTWSPTDDEQKDYTRLSTKTTLEWTIPAYSWANCSNIINDTMCYWPSNGDTSNNRFIRNQDIYEIRVNVTNAWKTESLRKTLNIPQITKPNPVKNFIITHLDSRSINVTWEKPIKVNTITVNYRLEYNSEWNKTMQTKTIQGSDTTRMLYSWILRDLIPNGFYTVSVIALSPGSSYESVHVTKAIQMPSDVPGANPTFCSGGYDVFRSTPYTRTVVLYICFPSKRDRHGEFTKLMLTFSNTHKTTLKGNANLAIFQDLTTDIEYDADIIAYTNKGKNSSLLPGTFTLLKESQIPQKPNNVSSLIDEDYEIVNVTWGTVHGASSYMISWCQVNGDDRECSAHLHQLVAPANISETSLKLNGSSSKFGVSAEFNGQYSPISWSRCRYRLDKTPIIAPLVALTAGDNHIDVDIGPYPCEDGQGKLNYYKICWCSDRCQDSCTEKVYNLPGESGRYRIGNLHSRSTVNVTVTGYTIAGPSPPYIDTVKTTGLSELFWYLLGSGIFVIVIFLLISVFCICRCMLRKISQRDVKIKLPKIDDDDDTPDNQPNENITNHIFGRPLPKKPISYWGQSDCTDITHVYEELPGEQDITEPDSVLVETQEPTKTNFQGKLDGYHRCKLDTGTEGSCTVSSSWISDSSSGGTTSSSNTDSNSATGDLGSGSCQEELTGSLPVTSSGESKDNISGLGSSMQTKFTQNSNGESGLGSSMQTKFTQNSNGESGLASSMQTDSGQNSNGESSLASSLHTNSAQNSSCGNVPPKFTSILDDKNCHSNNIGKILDENQSQELLGGPGGMKIRNINSNSKDITSDITATTRL